MLRVMLLTKMNMQGASNKANTHSHLHLPAQNRSLSTHTAPVMARVGTRSRSLHGTSVLHPQHVYHHDTSIYGDIERAIPEIKIIQCIPFVPSRIALHLSASLTSLTLKTNNDEDYDNVVKKLHATALNEIRSNQSIFENAKQSTEKMLQQFYLKRELPIATHEVELFNQFKYLIDKLRADETLSSLTELDLGKIASQIASQNAVKQLHTIAVQSIVERIIEQYIIDNIRQPIQHVNTSASLNPVNKRPVFIIAGAPASGKSTIAQNISSILRTTGQSVLDLSYIATDNFRYVLQSKDGSPEQNQQSAGYVHEEACHVTDTSLELFRTSCDKRRSAPPLLFECVDPRPEKIEQLSHEDNTVYLDVTQCDPQTSLKRNNDRFNTNGTRLTPPDILLKSHQAVANTIPNVLTFYSTRTNNLRVRLFDTNVNQAINAANINLNDKMILSFNSTSGCLTVKRIKDFLKTIKNSLNNPDSFDHEKMFFSDNCTIDDIVSQFVKQYGELNIQFSSVTNDGHESVYASYDKENGFCIQDKTIFQAMIAADVEVDQFFTSLQSMRSTNSARPERV